jgi:hypothetical protein
VLGSQAGFTMPVLLKSSFYFYFLFSAVGFFSGAGDSGKHRDDCVGEAEDRLEIQLIEYENRRRI